MAAFMGIDLGTSSIKALIVDETGTILSQAAKSYQFASPINGYAQQDPKEWWEACCQVSREAVKRLGHSPEVIKGVGFSGQMHGLVILDAGKKPVRPVILHCDTRGKEQVEELNRILGRELILDEILNPYCAGITLTSLLWVRENEPENYSRIRYLMLPKDYLKFCMTGEISTDYSDASGTLAYHVKKGEWSGQVLDLLQIPKEWFPPIYESADVVGVLSETAAAATGLKAGTLVTAGGSDQTMQAIGNGILYPGQATSNIGTSGQISIQSDTAVLNPCLNTNTFTSYRKDRWYVMGAMTDAGASLKWLNGFFGKPDYPLLNRQVEQVRPGSGGLIFLPYLSGNRSPHVNPDISGVFFGLTLNTRREQLTRAVMEGVVYALKECMDLVVSLGLPVGEITASGGGARSEPWLQIQADVYGIPIRTTETEEQAGLGAAIAAGVGAGVYRDISEGCRTAVRYSPKIYEPNQQNRDVYREYFELYKEIYRSSQKTLEKTTLLGRRG